MSKVKVLIVDDSALIRQLLTRILSADPTIEVVGTATDPYDAREKIKLLNPDVLTLDIEMPRMDGITFLGNLMRLRPMPVVMISSLTTEGAEETLRALELGAVDFIPKPKVGVSKDLELLAETINTTVKAAARSKVKQLQRSESKTVKPKLGPDTILSANTAVSTTNGNASVIAIGASTGGTEAIKEILQVLPVINSPILITQHIPAAFSAPFARRMDACCSMPVHEAVDGQALMPGQVYIAPGDQHLLVDGDNGKLRCKLSDGDLVNRHRPAVDVLFRSIAQRLEDRGLGILLTGMGDDGARGLLEIREAGGATIAQDEETSVVWGMPGEAVRMEAAQRVMPLDKVASAIYSFGQRK
ncbi:MAG: chemotaxis response regulator protein-glutamate methylesterase [Motiliproteus sp.]|nr:chemotaxis response regulator protein-glutamate methylesterase [Motiliproteus sp.]MCW9053052.1 chemotaxis response regulator protein-glutamate methylesterase [Motiliproteus sp.]